MIKVVMIIVLLFSLSCRKSRIPYAPLEPVKQDTVRIYISDKGTTVIKPSERNR